MADFTGQNIQDTYQRVVQVDGNQLQDGTGSVLPISFNGDDVIIPGALRATSYIISQSTTIATSGSTIFGNSFDDTHVFSGSVNIGDRVNTDYNTVTPALFVRQDAVDRSQIANGFGVSIDLHTQRGSSTNGSRSGRIASRLTTGAQTTGDYYALDFSIRADDTQVDILTLDSRNTNTAGRVGILDTTPSYTLDVNGTFRTTGNVILGNASSDAHTINGTVSQITSAGVISSSNKVQANTLVTDSGNIIGDTSEPTQLVVSGFMTITGAITASSDISSSGTIISENSLIVDRQYFGASGGSNIHFTKSGNNLALINGGLATSEITASGDISASGKTTATSFDARTTSEGFLLQGAKVLYTDGDGHHHVGNHSVPLALTGSSIEIGHAGDTGLHITASGNISSSGNILSSNISSLTTTTASLLNSVDAISVTTASLLNSIDTISVTTGSLLDSVDAISIVTGSYAITGSDVTFNSIELNGSITASGIIDANTNKTILGDPDGNVGGVSLTVDQIQNRITLNTQPGGHMDLTADSINIVDSNGDAVTRVKVNGSLTASSDISSSGTVIGATGSFGRIKADDTILADEFIKLNVNNKFIQGVETGGTSRNILGINDSDIVQLSNQNISTEIKGTTIDLDASVTASNDISASGDIYGQTIYALQFEHFSSNFTFDFDGTLTDTVFMPISDQSTSEHGSSATNVNVNRTSIVPGRPIKTTVRSTGNDNLRSVALTCSVFYNQPGVGSAGAGPGDTNSGQTHLVTAATMGPNSNHAAIELDFTNPVSGSWEDMPAGSRFYMTMDARGAYASSGGSETDLENTTFIVTNLWRWDYTQL